MKMVAIFIFLFLISQFPPGIAQQRESIVSLESSLSPNNKSYWLSSSGQFAFGFYQKDNGFAIGIWFEKIQQKTIIWTANRDDPPLPKDVELLLTNNGRLVLRSKDGQQTSLLNASLPACSSASMHNTGNFVLYSSDSRIIWQSFDVPTDTILPGQRLPPGKQLVSSISGTNHASGNFQLLMQNDGNLVQYLVNGPREPDYSYWDSETFTAGDNVTLNLDGNGWLYLLNATGFSIKNFTAQRNPSYIAFYRFTIDFDGLLRLYSHSLNQSDDWITKWASSTNRCDPLGVCGPNSYCTLLDQEPICECSPGFDFVDQKQKNLGCKRNFITEGCMSKNGEFNLQELEAVAWEDNPYSTFPSTKSDCREDCLRDCNCEAAVFKDQQCSKQKLPLRFGRIRPKDSWTTIIKVGNGSSEIDKKGK